MLGHIEVSYKVEAQLVSPLNPTDFNLCGAVAAVTTDPGLERSSIFATVRTDFISVAIVAI